MRGTMKIFLYEISKRISIEGAINRINSLPMQDRVRDISGYDMKLEEVSSGKVSGNAVWLMDFCKHRDSGPGLAKTDAKIQGFNLAADEAFGEMTATLYDPASHFIAIQYNHYGPRAGSIAKYISEFVSGKQLIFEPRLKDDVLAEIERKRYNASFSFRYSSTLLTKDHMKKLAMSTLVDGLERMGENVGEVEITVRKKRYSRGMMGQIPLMKCLLQISSEVDGAIKSAKVKGAMSPGDEPELLDILNAKISDERGGLTANPRTKMYAFEDRCRLLKASFRSWKESGIITTELR